MTDSSQDNKPSTDDDKKRQRERVERLLLQAPAHQHGQMKADLKAWLA